TFVPSLEDINKIGHNPVSPTNWAALFSTHVSGMHTVNGTPGSFSEQRFLFDTGAQVTVLSQTTASQLGIHLTGEDPTAPDFYVEVGGVGGVTENVPGFYINQLSVV